MNKSIATITEESTDRSPTDSLHVVLSPYTNKFGIWVERFNPADHTSEMSTVTWITKDQAIDLSIALQKESA